MSTLIIDYTLDSVTPANPDASLPATIANCTVAAGPGAIAFGNYPKALDFAGGGTLSVALPAGKPNPEKFSARVVFKPGGAMTARETLLASDALPIALALEPGSGTSEYHLVARVTTQAHGSGAASSQHLMDLKVADWHAADLVYDTDTVALFVDGAIVSVHAFPDGTLATAASGALHAGTAADGIADPFKGLMAALQLHDEIPLELEAQLDERRAHPQWHLTYKQEELNLGAPQGEFYLDLPSDSWIQEFAGTMLMYHETTGQAFELHGAILAAYRAYPNRIEFGFLISDEMDGARGGSRKSLFSRGGFYWSPGTGAIPVLNQIWVDYEGMGESAAIGLPVAPVQMIGGGRRQVFQGGEMYWKNGASKAFEVHGAILSKFLATGGTASWGFPITNETDVRNGAAVIGRQSEFDVCTIFWSNASGAFEVHGDIRRKYVASGGPGGNLGFPTSDESDIPGAAGRYNTFQHGSILWFGSFTDTFVCLPFDIRLTRVNTKESEGWGKGSNDVYLYASIADNGQVLYAGRSPASGDSDGNNIFVVDKTFDVGSDGIVPNDPNRNIVFRLEIWESDWPDDDDYLGTFEYTLNMANAWGLRDNPVGVFNSAAFDNVNSVAWSLIPRIDLASLTEAQKWWGVKNKKTDEITYAQYATAFRDVDSDSEWWDPSDWLSKLFYEAVCKGLADKGNCFGMSLEAIYSKKLRSALALPIDRFTETSWETVRNEFNIKHLYQVGASAIWWFVGEFLSGKTHDPVAVFQQTRALHAAGCDPVLCIAANWDFSGGPHCVLPVGWDDSTTPWRMFIRDPNFPTMSPADAPREILVDPSANTYTYVGSSRTYNGSEWSGGRMHYMPYEVLCERPRTPVFEALMLLLSGVILIVAGDSETSGLTDENGVDLDAFGADSINRMKNGKSLTNKFVSVKGFDQHRRECSRTHDGPRPEFPVDVRNPRGHGVLTSELYLRSEPKQFSRTPPKGGKRGGDDWKRLTLREYLCQFAPHEIREKFERNADYVAANNHRLMYTLTDERLVKEVISPAVTNQPPAGAVSKNYIHSLRALRRGKMQYGIKEGLSEILVTADTSAGDLDTIRVKDLGTHTRTLSLTSTRDKVYRIVVDNRLGAGDDRLRIDVEGIVLPAGKELHINVRPGIGGIELVAAGQEIEAQVRLHYVRRGLELKSRFALKEQDGLRVVPSTFISSNKLKVSRINALFGAPDGSKLVLATP